MVVPRLSRWQAGALAVTAVALLLALEVVDEQQLDLLELGLELVEISLIVAASFAVMVLFTAIDQQFDRWNLTPAEKDVALLLLKGFSHKEVAQLRSRGERTVRQQALAVYRKSKSSGRASLAAYFLEDLLLPLKMPD